MYSLIFLFVAGFLRHILFARTVENKRKPRDGDDVPLDPDAQVLRGPYGHLLPNLRSNPHLRVVVLPPLRDVVYRAGLSEPHLTVVGWRGSAGGRGCDHPRGPGVQSLAKPVEFVPRGGVSALPDGHQEGAPHLLRHEPLGPGPSDILHLRSRRR